MVFWTFNEDYRIDNMSLYFQAETVKIRQIDITFTDGIPFEN
jgi:hypothetical protein